MVNFSKEILKGAADPIVLQALKENGDMYGYQLIKAIATGSNNIFEMQEGTVYPLLYRLEDKGYVESYKKNAPSGKERRYYHLTKLGEEFVTSRVKELKQFTEGLGQVFHFA